MRTAKLAAALAAVLAAAAPAAAYRPVDYPGAAWGALSRDFSGFEGYGSQGWVRQGATWAELPGGIALRTYGYYRWRFRGENRLYYDSQGPALSVEMSKGFVSVGAGAFWERFEQLRRQVNHHDLFAEWYKRLKPARGLPLSTWGRLTRDLDGIEGNGAQGWIQQGVEAVRLPGEVLVEPFAAYRWRVRSLNRPYYNTHGPAVGVELRRGPVQLVFEHAWRNYPELRRDERAYQLALYWYHEWNLKRR